MSVKRADFKAEEVIAELRQANQSLLRQLSKAKVRNEELVAAVYRAAKDAAESLTLSPVPRPKPDKRIRTGEVAIAVLSDWQMGKVSPTYNSAVCEKRIEKYANKLAELTEIQRADHPVRECRIYLLGDLVEGELVFGGQAHEIDASLYEQVLVSGRRVLAQLIRRALASFERVRVCTVIGNHSFGGFRLRKEFRPETNADAMLYETTRLILKGENGENEPRLEWASNWRQHQRKWYAVDYIGDKGFFLWHGDQARGGFAGYPWYSVGRRLASWRSSIKEPWRYSLSGHFHTPVRLYLNGITHWCNGSTESDNLYALEEMSASGEPCQWLLFAEPRRGVTAEYLVQLGEK